MLLSILLSVVFVLRFQLSSLQHFCQLGISTVVRQYEKNTVKGIGAFGACGVFRRAVLSPPRSRLQPEDNGRNIPGLSRRKQIARHRCIRLGHAAVEFSTKAFTQRFRRTADDLRNVVLTHSNTGEIADLLAHRIADDKWLPRHLTLTCWPRGGGRRGSPRKTGPSRPAWQPAP